MDYVRENLICTTVFCTSCGCLPFRRLTERVGWARMAELLNAVTPEELSRQTDLDWHDALEIMLLFHSDRAIADSAIHAAYRFVFDEYYRLRREEGLRIPEARRAVIAALREKCGGGSETSGNNE